MELERRSAFREPDANVACESPFMIVVDLKALALHAVICFVLPQPRHCNSEVWSSSDGIEWELECQAAPWEGRHCAGYCIHEGMMWIVGGDANQGHYQPDVWCSVDGRKWDQVCHSAPWCARNGRIAQVVLAHAGSIYVMGGQNFPGWVTSFGVTTPSAPQVYYGDVWRSTTGADWEKIAADCPWAPRGYIGGSAVKGGRMFLLGGGTYETPAVPERIYKNDVWSSADGIDWVMETASAPWRERQMHETTVFDGKIWVLDGFCGFGVPQDGTSADETAQSGCVNDVWYSENGRDWHEVKGTPWPARHAASVWVHNGSLWLGAGSRTDILNGCRSDIWCLEKQPRQQQSRL